MSDAQSSPPIRASNKTYARRVKKKRRATIDATYKDTGPHEEDTEEGVSVSPKQTRSAKNATRTPKKVDVHLPGPTSKRTPTDPSDRSGSITMSQSARGKRTAHSRAGSVASIPREDTLYSNDISPTDPVTSTKPLSHVQRKDTPEDGADDISSVGESSKRARKTEAERRQFLEEDANSGDVEAHRVFCKGCNEWIELNPKLRFVMKNWLEHRKRCKGIAECAESLDSSKEKTTEDPEDDDASIAGASVLDTPVTGIKRVKKEEDRKAIIEADPLSGEVKSDMVFCKGCQNWVKLQKDTRYSLNPWRNHTQKCSGMVPSTRVATAQRKLRLVNDPQMKSFTARSVECKLCDAQIGLESKIDYDLKQWDEHKSTCAGRRAPPPPMKLIESASSSISRPPPSVASTEETIVATEAATPQKSLKRSREEEEAETRSVRQRGASYEAPQGESPGFLDWITAPFKNFIRDFRQGLSG